MQKIGLKPGFTMAFSLVPRKFNPYSMEEIANFFRTTFSQTLFNVLPKCDANTDTLKISFSNKSLPSFLHRFGPFNQPLSQTQMFWFKVYTYFMLGVYEGAMIHFGYKIVGTITYEEKGAFSIDLRVERNNGDWEDAFVPVPKSSI